MTVWEYWTRLYPCSKLKCILQNCAQDLPRYTSSAANQLGMDAERCMTTCIRILSHTWCTCIFKCIYTCIIPFSLNAAAQRVYSAFQRHNLSFTKLTMVASVSMPYSELHSMDFPVLWQVVQYCSRGVASSRCTIFMCLLWYIRAHVSSD